MSKEFLKELKNGLKKTEHGLLKDFIDRGLYESAIKQIYDDIKDLRHNADFLSDFIEDLEIEIEIKRKKQK